MKSCATPQKQSPAVQRPILKATGMCPKARAKVVRRRLTGKQSPPAWFTSSVKDAHASPVAKRRASTGRRPAENTVAGTPKSSAWRKRKVVIKCSDRSRRFQRSVTASDGGSVPEVRDELNQLKQRAAELTYNDVVGELAAIRTRFVDYKRCRLPVQAAEDETASWGQANIPRAATEAFKALGSHRQPIIELLAAKAGEAKSGEPSAEAKGFGSLDVGVAASPGAKKLLLDMELSLEAVTAKVVQEQPAASKKAKRQVAGG